MTKESDKFIEELDSLLTKYNLAMCGNYEEYVLFKDKDTGQEQCSYLEGNWYLK